MKNQTLTPDRISAYLDHLHTEERAAATLNKYRRDITLFAEWLEGRPVTKEAAAQWKAYLLDMGKAPNTVNAKLSAINGLFQFCGWDDCRVKFLKVQRRVFRDAARDLTKEDYYRLREAASETNLELSLLMETICATGIRVSEVRYITVEAALMGRTDVSLKGKIRSIILPNKLCRKLVKYAKKRKIASGAIFRTADGAELSRFRIWKAMKDLAKDAGVEPSKVFPHNLRHLFATIFYRATRDIVKLADLLGHSSINTTRIYLLTTGEEHAKEVELLGLVS